MEYRLGFPLHRKQASWREETWLQLPESIEISSIEVLSRSHNRRGDIDTIKDALDEVPPEIIAL